MEQLNRVELKGNIGSVRLSDTTTGKRMARFSLATNYLYKNREGDASVETTWHSIVAFESRTLHNLEKLDKGISVHVIGRIRSTKYTGQDGIERSSYEIVAQRIVLLDDEPEER
ncbi:MAG: single-stranded DNA-binding protein [Bacteroidales bacterium]|nr:single-stranded DNA-binding protein [Bacteroidales bacterium]